MFHVCLFSFPILYLVVLRTPQDIHTSAVNILSMESSTANMYAGPSVKYRPYRSEEYDLKDIMDLVDQELSEPYVICSCYRPEVISLY